MNSYYEQVRGITEKDGVTIEKGWEPEPGSTIIGKD